VEGAVLNFPVIPGRSLSENFTGVPEVFAKYLRQGFNTLAKLPRESQASLITQFAQTIDSPRIIDEEKFAERIGIKEEEIGSLLAAVGMVTVALSSTEDSAPKLVEEALKAKIVSESDQGALLSFAEMIVKQRDNLKNVLTESQTASRILPALEDFSTVVDVRPIIKKGQITSCIPVVLVHLDTDMANEELCFQMSKNQLKQVLERLNTTLQRVEQLEIWTKERSTK